MNKIFFLFFSIFLIGIVSAQSSIYLNSPDNNTIFNTNSITFNCSANYSSGTVENISLIINGNIVYTLRNLTYVTDSTGATTITTTTANKVGMNFIAKNSGESLVNITKFSGDGETACYLYSNDTLTLLASGGFIGDNCIISYPLTQNTGYWGVMDGNGSTVTISHQDSITSIISGANINYEMSAFNFPTGKEQTSVFAIYSITTGNGKSSLNLTQTISSGNLGENNWTCQSTASDMNTVIAPIRSFNISSIINSLNFNLTSFETKFENFILNLSLSGIPDTIKMNYDGVNYTGTSTAYSGNNYIFSSGIDIPIVSSNGNNKSLFFTYNINNVQYNTSIYQQTVNYTTFGLCNSTLNKAYINYTFQDENNLTLINASISYSNFTYYLGDGNLIKSLIFINNSLNTNYQFCSYPSYLPLNITSYIQFLSTNYPQRSASESLQLTNISTNRTYYLLLSSQGIYVTFQVISPSKQTISGVSINGTRSINGNQVIVAQGTTDSAGLATFWLNPNFLHNFAFFKIGYPIFLFSTTPTQSAYTITLTGSGSGTPSIQTGIVPIINPSDNFLNNRTIYNFNLSFTSQYFSISNYGFNLTYDNGTLIGGATGTSGVIGLYADTAESNSITMNYFYVVNGTTSYGQQYWIVHQKGNVYSIYNFFNDLSLYISAGMFGIDNFGKALISLVILIMTVGGLSYRYGIVSEPMIAGVLFGLVLFLDNLGFIPSTSFAGITPIPHFITFITAFILIGMIIREGAR